MILTCKICGVVTGEFGSYVETYCHEHTPQKLMTIEESRVEEYRRKIEIGKGIIQLFSEENAELNLGIEEISYCMTTLESVSKALESGALETAFYLVQYIVPGSGLSQERIDKYRGIILSYL
jgi:hypothetical protein